MGGGDAGHSCRPLCPISFILMFSAKSFRKNVFVPSGVGVLLVRRIQDFPKVGASTPKFVFFVICFAENCIKMKEFGPPGESLAPPLEPPMLTLYY